MELLPEPIELTVRLSKRKPKTESEGWPNPIASSIVQSISIDSTTLQVRGLDRVDGAPLLDLKLERGAVVD
jgi:hypothetical protein